MPKTKKKTYRVLYGLNMPHYGEITIKASSDERAVRRAKRYPLEDVFFEPYYEGVACRRIVEIAREEEPGKPFAGDISLDDAYRMHGHQVPRRVCEEGSRLLEALKLCEDALSELARTDDGTPSISALQEARAAIAAAEGRS